MAFLDAILSPAGVAVLFLLQFVGTMVYVSVVGGRMAKRAPSQPEQA